MFILSNSCKKAFHFATSSYAVAGTIIGISGNNIPGDWRFKLAMAIIIYFVLTLIAWFVIHSKKSVEYKIKGNKIFIKCGDIFSEKGLKVIPFNEHFDTEVDDVIISKNTLNGKFILNYVKNIEEFNSFIQNENEATDLKRKILKDKSVYPLGRIIKYNDFLLLAFTHFDKNNIAHISKIEYEKCLLNMWKELRRTYTGEKIFLPLIGSGITKFDDVPEKSNLDLLKCVLCTLKASGEQFTETITILVTNEIWEDLNLFDNSESVK